MVRTTTPQPIVADDLKLQTPTFDQLALYVSLVRNLKQSIDRTQKIHCSGPPRYLTRRTFLFLQAALGLNEVSADYWWKSYSDMAWDTHNDNPTDLTKLIPLYLEHGLALGVSCYELFPPMRRCATDECPANPTYRRSGQRDAPELDDIQRHQITVFTRAHGPVPGWSTSTYCRSCYTRFYHNFSVRGNIRTYYDREPGSSTPWLENSTHFFIEADLCERFANELTMAWVSSQNCAQIYNSESMTLPWAHDLPLDWKLRLTMEYEDVGESFIMYSLLNWHSERGSILQVPHNAPTQTARWHQVVQARNIAMAGTGQPDWNHSCSRCTKHVLDDQGNVVQAFRSVVVDGISLGHPCCAIHDCKELLPNNKHRYCASHAHIQEECAVTACREPAVKPHHTCDAPTHRQAEERYIQRGKAMFQLKERLRKLNMHETSAKKTWAAARSEPATPADEPSEEPGPDDEEEVVDEHGAVIESCDDKPAGGHRKVFARFGRRRTHNEELCVTSCGVIIARATFYGAEGPNSVRVFLKNVFPTHASLPSVIWFDTNCLLSEMLKKDGDTYFEHVAMPVDVFHFGSKHQVSHEHCGRYCNPALWPELMDQETGKWVFNSSAAEQANVWIGGFRAITRIMRQDRYNFLLDEVIMRRNRFTIAELERAGCAPYSMPRDVLLREDQA